MKIIFCPHNSELCIVFILFCWPFVLKYFPFHSPLDLEIVVWCFEYDFKLYIIFLQILKHYTLHT